MTDRLRKRYHWEGDGFWVKTMPLGHQLDFQSLMSSLCGVGGTRNLQKREPLWEQACAHEGNPIRKIYLFDISSFGHGKNQKQCPDLSLIRGKCVAVSLNYPSCSDKTTLLLCGDTMWDERARHLTEVWSGPHQPVVRAHKKGEVPAEGGCLGAPDGDQGWVWGAHGAMGKRTGCSEASSK